MNLNEFNKQKIAEEIINIVIDNISENSVQYSDFNIKNGVMITNNKKPNVSFKFLTSEDSETRKAFDFIVSSYETENYLPENEILDFENSIKLEINNQISNYKENLKNSIIKAIFQFKEKEQFDLMPCDELSLAKLMFNHSFNRNEDGGYSLVVHKMVPKNKADNTSGIANELIQESIQTGLSFELLIERHKKEQEDMEYEEAVKAFKEGKTEFSFPYRWKYISKIEKKYYDSEIQVGFYVDFSLKKIENAE